VGSAFAVVGVVAALNQIFLTGRLSKRFGEARVLASGMALTMVFTALQALSVGGITTVPFLAVAAWGQSIAWPNVSALISRNVDWEHQGQYLGLNNAVGASARLVGPSIAAFAFADLGIDAPFFTSALLVLPAIFFAWSTKRPREPDVLPAP